MTTSFAQPDRYVFDRGWDRERERLEMQARLLDAGTIERLEALGPGEGWCCAEVAAGAGSIARWLARRLAGVGGRVVATDLDTRFLDGFDDDGLEVRRHDIVAGPLEAGAYDLVHTRLLLRHLREPDVALANMVASLRPGGWLLVEDFDLVTAPCRYPVSERHDAVNAAVERMLAAHGVDTRYGMKLPGALRAAGLVDVEADARLRVVSLGTPDAEAFVLKLEQFRDALVEEGWVARETVDQVIAEARCPEGDAVHYPPLTVAAWGRKPH